MASERPTQLGFALDEREIFLSDLNLIVQEVISGQSVAVFFDEVSCLGRPITEMERFALEFRKLLKEKGKSLVFHIDFSQLLFHNHPLGRPPSGLYTRSPLECNSSSSCMAIVENFQNFNPKDIASVQELIDNAPESIGWVILVPRWQKFQKPKIVLDWLKNKRWPQFRVELDQGSC